ncbi:hypothetical protein VISI1226_13728 [Vibrio sinaloensis DSM 21326]|uniref:Uncharacterized protein n=1 Tax=Vibrio sinaloensis DSM 21326 TaxID=945550 RepID=E8M8P1_PHOS4|nr:hypothetical protein [Vibrio sinaloensis]EGA69586.1 hypothetical protein VISI1226_13728 [Vibrio sinaloensis DSM 21326]
MDSTDNTPLETEHDELSQDYAQGLNDLDHIDAAERGEPETTEQPEQSEIDEPQLDAGAAVAMVEMGMFMSQQYISSAAGVDFQFDAEAKEKFLTASGPLIEKYGLTWLAWFENYKEEIMFGVAAVGLGYSSLNAVKRLQAEQAAIIAEKAKEAANDEQEQKAAA